MISGLRSNPATARTYVVLLTMRSAELAQALVVNQPRINVFLTKPITLEAIRTFVLNV